MDVEEESEYEESDSYDSIYSRHKLKNSVKEAIRVLNLYKKCANPIVAHKDTVNPRKSKFGGHLPILPCEEAPVCPLCHRIIMMIGQFYINDLPDFSKALFPEEHQKSLLVLMVCGNGCNYTNTFSAKIYTEDQLDDLIYIADYGAKITSRNPAYQDISSCFQPSIITGWDIREAVPSFAILEKFIMPVKDFLPIYSSSKFYDSFSTEFNEQCGISIEEVLINFLDDLTEQKNTSLGGYPMYLIEDQTPYNVELFLNISQTEAATFYWNDEAMVQIWMETGENFGKFILTYDSA